MSDAYRVELGTVGDRPTALGSAGPLTLVADRATAAGGGGLGFNGGQLLYLAVARAFRTTSIARPLRWASPCGA